MENYTKSTESACALTKHGSVVVTQPLVKPLVVSLQLVV